MFNKSIFGVTLASDAANRLFSNVTATGALDQSFIATLRALVRNRLPQDETLHLNCWELQIPVNDVTAATTSECMSWFVPDAVLRLGTFGHSITIIHMMQQDSGAKMLEIVKANAGQGRRYLDNYKRRDDLHVFYARKVKALFYTDDTERNTIIFVERMELKHFHALQMMIPKYLPLLFAAPGRLGEQFAERTTSPLTETDTALLKSCGNKSAVEYETLIEKFAKDLDIRAEIVRIKLAGFETVFERMRANELKDEINSYQDSYEYHLSQMRDLSHKLQECKYTLAGLECAIDQQAEDSELMEYFMCNKNLSIIKVMGTAIEFIAHGYADIYDADAFEQYVGNLNGYMYSDLHSAVSKPQMQKLYRAIFDECKYKLRICAAYTADMRTGLRGLSGYVFPPESRTYLHNPHIQVHGCIGSYGGRFQEYMQKRDYVGGIDQAVVSARNLNFYDSTVMSTFAKELSRTTISCIEKPDGTLLTPQEAILELEGGGDECHDPLF